MTGACKGEKQCWMLRAFFRQKKVLLEGMQTEILHCCRLLEPGIGTP